MNTVRHKDAGKAEWGERDVVPLSPGVRKANRRNTVVPRACPPLFWRACPWGSMYCASQFNPSTILLRRINLLELTGRPQLNTRRVPGSTGRAGVKISRGTAGQVPVQGAFPGLDLPRPFHGVLHEAMPGLSKWVKPPAIGISLYCS